MRIAILSDEYLPAGTRVHSKMLHELAVSLVKSGHQLTVITPGSPHQNKRLLVDFIDDVEVWRFTSGYTKGVGMLHRAITEFLLPFRSWRAIRARVNNNDDFDLCINYSPTIFFGPLARRFRKRGTYIYLVLRDMFPQWVIDQGIIKEKSLPAFIFRHYEKINYQTANCIGVMSKANLDVFREKFPSFDNVKILRNWASLDPVSLNNGADAFRSKLGLVDKVVFFYGGNIGHAQDMENIMRLARNLKTTKEVHFLLIGQGDEFSLIQHLKHKWGLDNVTILPAVSQKEFSNILATVDVGLFSLSYKHSAHNFPGKLLAYMVESKPILGSVNPGNDLLELINGSEAGAVFINGDDTSLADAAMTLATDVELRVRAGAKAQDLLQQQFSVEAAAFGIIAAMD
mgnify:CR=1 FL=1